MMMSIYIGRGQNIGDNLVFFLSQFGFRVCVCVRACVCVVVGHTVCNLAVDWSTHFKTNFVLRRDEK